MKLCTFILYFVWHFPGMGMHWGRDGMIELATGRRGRYLVHHPLYGIGASGWPGPIGTYPLHVWADDQWVFVSTHTSLKKAKRAADKYDSLL